ncbi:ATP-NAD kinase family protein [Micromonospora sp. NPDC048830]|uniref:ATP-NAD kinase family protein n=1 Tax=Micromonospora sp. NPDC048830 TaxID=3364257 RepID=UPI003711DB2A
MRIGLIVNPMAGLGGRVGLHGSDSAAVRRQALARGAVSPAADRAGAVLARLACLDPLPPLVTVGGAMGEQVLLRQGLCPEVVWRPPAGRETSAQDTRAAARALQGAGVDILLFVGGDGTARDVCAAVGTGFPALGVPSGVKMHSAVFGVSPRACAEIVIAMAGGRRVSLAEREVVDLDEDARRAGVLASAVFGVLTVPYLPEKVQARKVGSAVRSAGSLEGAAREVVERMEPGRRYVLGPGMTTAAVSRALGLQGSLLGVDVVADGRLLGTDLSEQEVLQLIDNRSVVVVSPIGGQGFLFGRGNQQISPSVLSRVGRQGILVVCPEEKLITLGSRPLLVDTGQDVVNDIFRGYVRVITGCRAELVYPVQAV